MRLKTLLLTACAFFVCAAASAGNNKVYLYGFAASFNDSTVYFTDIQELDSAVVDRGGFLYGRDSYKARCYRKEIPAYEKQIRGCFR